MNTLTPPKKEDSYMEECPKSSLSFDILDSKFVDVNRSTIKGNEIILEIEHSTTRSAYVKLWKGHLSGQQSEITFEFETNNKIDSEKTEAFIEVRCLESLESPKVYPIDFLKGRISVLVKPTTSWETTEISLYLTHIFPPLKDTSRTFSIKNVQIRQDPMLNFCSHVFERINMVSNETFVCTELADVHLSKGKYTLKHTIESTEDVYKLGIVFTSKKNIGHTIVIPLGFGQGSDFEVPSPEEFKVSVYAFCKIGTHISVPRLALYTHSVSDTLQPKTKVCVVVPSFECAAYIERSVLSLVNQTRTPQAIYIVDDKSTDHTQKVIQGLKEIASSKDILLDYIRLEHNCGPYFAKNMAIYQQVDNFDYIALQDADDYSESTRLEKQIATLEESRFLANYTFMQRMREGELVKNRGLDARRSYATGLFKAQYFKEFGYFETAKFGADDEMFNRGNCKTKTSSVLKDVLYFAEYRENSLTTSEEQVSLDKDTNFLSGLRKSYADSFSKRYTSGFKECSFLNNPLYLNTLTPKEISAFPQITFNIASYPPRFSSLTKVLKNILAFVENVGGLINVCLNNVSSLPAEMKEFESHETINFIFPKRDLKDNGKFINIRQGFNFWLDDDILYTQEYFIHMMYKILTTPPNSVVCVHGSNGGSAYSIDRKVRHFRAYYPNTIKCEIGGTGTIAMCITEPFILKRLRSITDHETTGIVDLLFALECSKLGIPIYNVDKRFELSPISQLESSTNLFAENKSRKTLMDSYMDTIRSLESL